MKAIRIQIPDKQIDFWTSDLLDLINEIESMAPEMQMSITTKEMEPVEFNKLIENGSGKANQGE